MINYLRVPGKVMAIAVALTMMAPVGMTFTDGNVNLADFPPTVTVNTPGCEDQILNGSIMIYWLATDQEENDTLLDINIQYSTDGGSSWFTIMSGTDNNNPPYAWDTVAAGVPDGVSYKFNVTAIDNASQSGSNTSYMFSIDNIPDDRWYLQIESTHLGTNLDLDMKPSESTIQEISVNVPTPGEIPVQTFASEYVASRLVDLMGDWNFSIFAKVSSSDADGNLYAKVYANDGVTQRLLFTTDYDDEYVGSYLTFHEFVWSYSVPPGTWIQLGEHVVVEIMLHATAGAPSTTNYHYADADIPVLGNVIGDYTMTFVSDNQREIIEEIEGSPGAEVAIIDEDFSGTWPPGGWQVVNSGNGKRIWTNGNPRNRVPNPPIIDPFAIHDMPVGQSQSRKPFDSQLITPAMDLSFATSVTLEFDQWYDGYSNNPSVFTATLDVRSNLTNGTWVNLLTMTNITTPNPNHRTFSLTPFAAGSPDVQVRFYLFGPGGTVFWMVDNVLVKASIVNTSLLEHKWTIDVPAGEEPYEFNLEANRKYNQGDDDFVFAYSTDDVNYIDMVTIDFHGDRTKTYPLPPTLSGTIYIRVEDTNRNSDYDISSIEIDQMFISSVSPPKLTIGFDHQSAPSFVEPALTLGPITYLCIQDAPGGNGNNVTTHIMTTDDTFTVWANGYDAGWNYVSDIRANWTNTLNSQTATTSTVFTLDPIATGTGTITADFNTTLSDTTGLITVTMGLLENIIIRDSPGGLGNEVEAYPMTTDDTLTVWAAGYDADGYYVGDVNCNWSTNGTLDFHSAIWVNNFTFDPSTAGTSGYITALNGTVFDSAGLITVGVGAVNYIIIRYAPGGGSSEVGDVMMVLGQSLTAYSAGYDIDNNYIGDIPCNWTTTGTLNFTTATSSSSFTFEPAAAGETGTINATFNSTISDETGTINVTAFEIDNIVIEDGLGNEITIHTMDTTETFTVWAIGYNLSVGAIGPVNANWTTTGTLDLQTATSSQTFTFDPIHAPTTGTIEAVFGALWDSTGTITVNLGPLTYLCIQDAPGGAGVNVTTHTMNTGETFTVWSIGYDAEWNYISEINCDWTTTGTLDLQTATGVNTFTFSPVNPGSGMIEADDLAGHIASTGLITVTGLGIDLIIIVDDFGTPINTHWMDTTETLRVWAMGWNISAGQVGLVPADWTTTGTLDLQTATSSQTFTFDPIHAPTSGSIEALYGTLWDSVPFVYVDTGPLANLCIQDLPGGTGTNVTTHTMDTTETLTVWAIGYDAEWNFILGFGTCDWVTTGTLDLQTATDVITFTFSPVNPGSGTIMADYNATISDASGLITVTDPITTFDIDITPAAGSDDWILISFPSQIEGNPLTLIVDSVDEGAGLVTWDVVQWFDPQSPPGTEWKTTATFKPPFLNTFDYVNNSYGFWIHITNYGDGNLTLSGPVANTSDEAYLYLFAGWNLVGYPFPTAQPMIDTFGILTNLDMPIETYDSAEPYRLRTADISTEDHEPGCGYWVHVTSDEILVIQCP